MIETMRDVMVVFKIDKELLILMNELPLLSQLLLIYYYHYKIIPGFF